MLHPARQAVLASRLDTQGVLPASGVTSGLQAAPYPAKSDHFRSGVEEFAYYRAELYLLERNALKRLGSCRGWSADLAAIYEMESDGAPRLQDVRIDDVKPGDSKSDGETQDSSPEKSDMTGIDDKLLQSGLGSENNFYRLYGVYHPAINDDNNY